MVRWIAFAQLAQTTVSGTLYTVNGDPNPSGQLTIFKVIKSGVVIISDRRRVSANASGAVSFTVPQFTTAVTNLSLVQAAFDSGGTLSSGFPTTVYKITN